MMGISRSFCSRRTGNSSDKVSLLSAIQAIQEQLRATDEAASVYVADNGVYSEANMRILNQAQVKWISRVSETSTHAKTALAQSYETWQASEDGNTHWVSQIDAASRRAKSAG